MAVLSGFISITDIQDGVAGPAITLTNEAHTFIASPEGMITTVELASFMSQIAVYVGSTQYSYDPGATPSGTLFTVGTLTLAESGADVTLNKTTLASTNAANVTGVQTVQITVTDAGATNSGFVDAGTSVDTLTITVPISLVVSGNTVTINKILSLTKSKGGDSRVIRLQPNQFAIEYPRERNAVPKNSSDFSAGGEVDLDFEALSYGFSAGDPAPVWSYRLNATGSFVNITQPANYQGVWAAGTTYTAGQTVSYTLNNKTAVFQANVTPPAQGTPPWGISGLQTGWTRVTTAYGLTGGTNDAATLTIGPLMFNDLVESGTDVTRVQFRVRRTIDTSNYDDVVTILKVQDALGAYRVEIESTNSTVFKNNVGTTNLTARLYLSDIEETMGINSYQWQKSGLNVAATAATAYSAATNYTVGTLASLVAGSGNDAFTYNFSALNAGTLGSPPTNSTGANPGSNSDWQLESVVIKATQGSGQGPTNQVLVVGATDIIINDSDLFTCAIDFTPL